MRKTWDRMWARTLALGVMGAALALPVAAAAAVRPALGDVVGRVIGNNGGVFEQVKPVIPTHVAQNEEDLVSVLNSEFRGKVILPAGRSFNMSRWSYLPLQSGVQLIGERGPLGSRPLVYTDTQGFYFDTEPPTPVAVIDLPPLGLPLMGRAASLRGFPLFVVVGNDVRVEGIHFRGSARSSRDQRLPGVTAVKVEQNAEAGTGRYVVIADNEFDQWTGSGVAVEGLPHGDEDDPAVYDKNGWKHLGPNDAALLSVERNYFHHNARDNLGYGVVVGGGAYATIMGNVFDYNRHAVAASGRAYSGYVARFNYVLQGGYRQDATIGSYYNQHFDVHGRGDGGYGGPAGEYFEIAFNTIRGEQTYYVTQTRPALMLRGTPSVGFHFHSNVLVHDNHDDAASFKGVSFLHLVRDGKYQASGNAFDTDYSTEMATGDFDGDGLTDVFVANGTAWFFSRGGVRPWEFLHASTKRLHELGFADIDNDGKTDVLYRDPNGNLGYLKSGVADLVNFTTAPVPMKELRFGDFDGDGKTDIFYTRNTDWWIWYGNSRTWTRTLNAATPVTEMLFGEFDGVRGTDLVAALPGDWAISSGASVGWVKLNNRLRGSFADAVAADFDGNGRTDIAFNNGQNWIFSRDGRSPLALLRDASGQPPYPPLHEQLVGRFDGGARAQVVTFERTLLSALTGPGERLVIWRGLGSGSAYAIRSEQNMR